jgi:type IV secretory pathway VirJ component
VLPEVEKLAAKRILCVYGQEETGSLCPQLSGHRVRVDSFKGAHHFGGSYEAIAHTILVELGK